MSDLKHTAEILLTALEQLRQYVFDAIIDELRGRIEAGELP